MPTEYCALLCPTVYASSSRPGLTPYTVLSSTVVIRMSGVVSASCWLATASQLLRTSYTQTLDHNENCNHASTVIQVGELKGCWKLNPVLWADCPFFLSHVFSFFSSTKDRRGQDTISRLGGTVADPPAQLQICVLFRSHGK